jgi:DNA-binding SARP family transcriptional activator
VEFRLLGPLQVADGAEWMSIRAPQQRAVLALLLLESGRLVTIDRLIDELWGDQPPASPHNTIHAYVMRLRRGLGSSLGDRLITRSPGYQLQVESRALDAEVFEHLVAEGKTDMAAGHWSTAATRLGEALDLWHGPAALADVPSTPAVAAERTRLEQQRLAAVEARIDADLELGRHATVVSELEQLTTEHPLRENIRRQLMLALYRCGRRTEALEVYRQGRRLLIDELGIEPAKELRDLERTILSDVERPPAVPNPRAPADGRGPDVIRRARPAGTGPPCMLPPDIADFTGRDEQVLVLQSLLTQATGDTARAVTALCGRGGIGKTALAVHVAHQLRTHFPDGQLYMDLHGVEQDTTDPDEVLARFLTVLGVDGRALPSGVEERAERYRALLAHRRLLVVLDNAASEQQIRSLLPGSPSCAVLVTARRRIRWLSANTIDLEALEPSEAGALLTRVVGAKRFSRETEAAMTITRLCGYLPLAIRIAGGRLAARPHWPLARMASRLTDERSRLDELSEDDMAVRASLELSYSALEPMSRRLFRALGLLDVPDFAAWVPAAMLDTSVEEAETHLDFLIDAQLLTWSGTDALGQNRYRLHDLVRLYARERAEHEDTTGVRISARTSALGTWLALAEAADRLLTERVAADIRGSGPKQSPDPTILRLAEADPLGWFDSERTSLAAVITQAGAAGLDELAWELAATAINYFAFRGLYHDWLHTHELARQVCARSGNSRGEAVMLRNLGYLRMTGVKAPSRIIMSGAETALETFRRTGDLHGHIDALFLRGFALRHKGDFDGANAHATEAMTAATSAGYELGQGRLWYLRAIIEREQGRHATAASYAELSFRFAEGAGAIHDRVLALWELAATPTDRDATRQTWDRLQEHIDQCRERGERLLEAYLLLSTGALAHALGRPGARDTIERALDVFDFYAVPLGRCVGFRLLGELDHAAGDLLPARDNLTKAIRISGQLGNTYEQAMLFKALGAVWHTHGDTDNAKQLWTQALLLFTQLDNTHEVDTITALLGPSGEV